MTTTESENMETARLYLRGIALEVTWIAVVAVPVGTIPAGGEMRANLGVFLQFRDGKISRPHNYDCFDPF